MENKRIQLNFWIEITGNFDETGDEAEVSVFNSSIPLQSDKCLSFSRWEFISI
jgi:hypothetical protein